MFDQSKKSVEEDNKSSPELTVEQQKLVEENHKLAPYSLHQWIKKFGRQDAYQYMDFFLSEAYCRLCTVVKKFNPEIAKLSTYAVTDIVYYLEKKYQENCHRAIHVPRDRGTDKEDTKRAKELARNYVDLNKKLDYYDAGREIEVGELIPNPNLQFEDDVVNSLAVDQILSCLDEKERRIVELYYIEDKTQSDVGRIVGLSQAQISRVIDPILNKLRNEVKLFGYRKV